MKKLLQMLIPLFCLLVAPLYMHAAEPQPPLRLSLLSEQTSVQPGVPFWVALRVELDEGWHTYWLNPGETGDALRVSWDLPQGVSVDDLRWPVPEKFSSEEWITFGYSNTTLLLAQVTPPKNFNDKTLELDATVRWIACKESCVPGEQKIHLSLPISETPVLNSSLAGEFLQAKSQLPLPLGGVQVQSSKESILLKFSELSAKAVTFFPEHPDLVDYRAQKVEQGQKGMTLTLAPQTSQSSWPKSLKGVLVVGEGVERQAYQIDAPLTSPLDTTLLLSLGAAFLGGLLLNIMPCVLPVITLKIFSLVKMGQTTRRKAFGHGLSFTMGVLVSFWILSGILLLLRAYGQGIGWGFQLQEPLFVVVLIAILFLLGLSLFGVFEMGTSLASLGQRASKVSSPHASSFLNGVLATVVATPCTGPLLGSAIGFAITLPAFASLAIFSAVGLGMAAPFLLFSLFPSWARILPKPGNWMIVFKKIMAFLMMATVAWLVWVFAAQTDAQALLLLLVALVLLGVGAWILGEWGNPTRARRTRLFAWIAALGAIAGSFVLSIPKKEAPAVSEVAQIATTGWDVYTPERVEMLKKNGTPFFVDFTAKWCLICQTNKVVLHSDAVTRAFAERGVVRLVADWTRSDPQITRALENFGRNGVPLYLLYTGSGEPLILPQTLTTATVLDAINTIDAR